MPRRLKVLAADAIAVREKEVAMGRPALHVSTSSPMSPGATCHRLRSRGLRDEHAACASATDRVATAGYCSAAWLQGQHASGWWCSARQLWAGGEITI